MSFKRRDFMKSGSLALAAPSTVAALSALTSGPAFAQDQDTLTIAYNVALPSWDPSTGPSSVNPTLQSVWKAVFDQYIDQNPDLSFKPGLLTEWGWNEDKTQVFMVLREGASWHDGKPITAQDVIWNLQRAADPASGNPVGGIIWSSITNLKADGNRITADVKNYVADLFKWMAFLTGYVIAPHRYEAVGAAGFA